jgi:hypothetical protein
MNPGSGRLLGALLPAADHALERFLGVDAGGDRRLVHRINPNARYTAVHAELQVLGEQLPVIVPLFSVAARRGLLLEVGAVV